MMSSSTFSFTAAMSSSKAFTSSCNELVNILIHESLIMFRPPYIGIKILPLKEASSTEWLS